MRIHSGDDASWAIDLFAGALALCAVTILAALLVTGAGPRLALLVAAVAVVAERGADTRTALGAAVLAFALGDGFLQNHAAVLTWRGSIDFPFALCLLGAAALGMCAAQIRLAYRKAVRTRPFVIMLTDSVEAGTPTPVGEEPRRRRDPVSSTAGRG